MTSPRRSPAAFGFRFVAHDLGYTVTLVVDAMTDRSDEMHRHSAEKVFPRLGETTQTDEVLKLLNELRA
jgi:nicotinamidase-related amidase